MPDVQIGSLSVAIQNASGHEHRVGPIAGRAASIFSARLDRQLQKNGATTRLNSIAVIGATTPRQFNLRLMSDEQAANQIASAWFEAVILQLKLGR